MKSDRNEPDTGISLQRARELRRSQTPLEAHLGSRLRAGQLNGYKFRRQHPVGPFIVDFCCSESKLIVEVDGDTHVEQEAYDAQRTEYLTSLGFKVVRITNRDVLGNIEGVLEHILGECMKRRVGG